MRFSKMFICFFMSFFMSCFMITSCSWIRDQPKPQNSFQTKMFDLSCLKQAPDQLQYLFEGKYTAKAEDQEEVKAIWSCLNKALMTFANNTHGSNGTYYSASELQQFANRYLKDDQALSRPFIDAIFNLKSAVLGGSNSTLTRPEIAHLISILDNFSSMVLPLSNQIETLLHPKMHTNDERQKAGKQLKIFVAKFAELLETSDKSLSWLNLNAFVSELEKYLRGDSAPTALTVVREQLPIYQYFKLLVVGGDERFIEKDKWTPILTSISNFYSALMLSSNSTELLEELSIKVQSTPEQQQIAVSKINGLLKALKNDPDLYIHDSIVALSDHWAKALMVNAVLFPKSQGSLSLKIFLESPTIRKLAGYIMDEATSLDTQQIDPALIAKISENVQTLINQAAMEANANSPFTGLSLAAFKDFCVSMKPLLQDPEQLKIATLAVDLFANIKSLLIGKSNDVMTAEDLRQMVRKLTDLYLAWSPNSKSAPKKSVIESMGLSLDTLTHAPYAVNLKSETIIDTLKKAQELTLLMKINASLPWEKMNFWVKSAFSLKAIFYGTNEQSFYYTEIKKTSSLLDKLRSDSPIETQLDDLARMLSTHPFVAASIEPIVQLAIPLYQSFDLPPLPSDMNAKNIGLLKAALIGGRNDLIAQDDYALLASAVAVGMKTIYPAMKELPANFKPGFNSQTLALAETSITALIDFQKNILETSLSRSKGMSLKVIKEMAISFGPRMGFHFDSDHLDKLLKGVPFRVLYQNKGKKPTQLDGALNSTALTVIQNVVTKFKNQLIELESVFSGYDLDTATLERNELKAKFKDPLFIHLISTFSPQLFGKENMLMHPKLGEKLTRYSYFDLGFKAMAYDLLEIILPAYQIEPVATLSQSARLTMNDLTDLLEDIDDVLIDFGVSFEIGIPAEIAKKRMTTVNVFTKTGNGDEFLDLDETLEFLTLTFGNQPVFERLRKNVIETCFPGVDYKTVMKIPGTCLVPLYFRPDFYKSIYQESIPQMANEVSKLNAAELKKFKLATLKAINPKFTETSVFSVDDLLTMGSIPQYIESVFSRLDASRDGVLQFSEAYAGFPIFCNELFKATAGKLGTCDAGVSYKLEAVYGYLISKGEAPRGIKPGDSLWVKLREAKNWYTWLYFWNHLPKEPEIRDSLPPQLKRKDMMQILSNLATSTETLDLSETVSD